MEKHTFFFFLLSTGILILLLSAFSFPVGPRRLASSCKSCNVVIIDIDLLRADALDCGKNEESTPNICSLEKKAVYFKNNISHADGTRPSFISTFTSLYPRSHTIWTPYEDRLNRSVVTLVDILKARGYKTVSSAKHKTPQINWDWFDEFTDYSQLGNNLGSYEPDQPFLLYVYLEDLHLPYILEEEDIKALEGIPSPKDIPRTWDEFNRLKAAYLVEHYKEVFKPELIAMYPEIFQGNLVENKYKLIDLFDEYGDDIEKQKFLFGQWKVQENTFMQFIDVNNPEHINYLEARYLVILKRVDKELAEIIQLSDETGLGRNTIIILKSDHGEEFNEHRNIGHGNNLYQETIHTPLFFKIPGTKPGETDKLTQDIDIMPTLLDLLGIELPTQLQGESLIPLIENPNISIRDYQIAQKGIDWIVSFRKRGLKIIMENSQVIELYDLASDPGETKNLLNKNENYDKTSRDLFEEYNQIIRNQAVYPNPKASFPSWMDEEKRKKLIEEGYF